MAFAFGTPDTIPSNKIIARIATEKARELHSPVFTEEPVICNPDIKVFYNGALRNKPWPTLRTARGAVQWAIDFKLNELWIVAAKPHLWRCMRDLTWAVQEEDADVRLHVCCEIIKHHDDEWFSRDSSQKYTRSPANWKGRDRILRYMPFWLYRLVAS